MKQLPASTQAWLLAALEFAAHKHRNQRRKDITASPYINHPIMLAHMLVAEGGVQDTKTLVAAILHDTVEDTDTTCEEIRARFGKLVADVVLEVTLPKARRKQLQIDHAPHLSKRAALVKLADKTANLRDMVTSPPVGWPLRRRQEYFDWARAVVEALPPVNKRLRQAFDAAHALRPSED
jgi:GTP diphosphokinase / guanosine-3',5'-bis(diphosphate) 3'-diphosphatase